MANESGDVTGRDIAALLAEVRQAGDKDPGNRVAAMRHKLLDIMIDAQECGSWLEAHRFLHAAAAMSVLLPDGRVRSAVDAELRTLSAGPDFNPALEGMKANLRAIYLGSRKDPSDR